MEEKPVLVVQCMVCTGHAATPLLAKGILNSTTSWSEQSRVEGKVDYF